MAQRVLSSVEAWFPEPLLAPPVRVAAAERCSLRAARWGWHFVVLHKLRPAKPGPVSSGSGLPLPHHSPSPRTPSPTTGGPPRGFRTVPSAHRPPPARAKTAFDGVCCARPPARSPAKCAARGHAFRRRHGARRRCGACCDSLVCTGDAGACATSCGTTADCLATAYCAASVCVPRQGGGAHARRRTSVRAGTVTAGFAWTRARSGRRARRRAIARAARASTASAATAPARGSAKPATSPRRSVDAPPLTARLTECAPSASGGDDLRGDVPGHDGERRHLRVSRRRHGVQPALHDERGLRRRRHVPGGRLPGRKRDLQRRRSFAERRRSHRLRALRL